MRGRGVAVALLLALPACGGDDGSAARTTTTTTTTTVTTTTTTSAPTTVATTTSTAAPTTSTAAPTTASPPATDPPPPPPASPPPQDVRGSVRLMEIGRFQNPLALVVRPGDATRYVVEQDGRIVTAGGDVVLDIRDEVGSGGERGLLGLAFHPTRDVLYVNYTDTNGDTHIVEFGFDPGTRRADPARRRELFFVDQPYANHNGGHLAFGPDGMLYAALGDGGSGGDPDNNAQSLDTLLGKLLRVDPTPTADAPYTIPPDNPFADRSGARGEIWSYGLRNPWRFSFDRVADDMWIGDVGQGSREEIDFQPADAGGRNYGWNYYEGSERFRGGNPPPDVVGPVYDYARANGNCAVTAGYRYRGAAIPRLDGHFVFGDFCRGELLALVDRGGYFEAVAVGGEVNQLSSFGQDHEGELYAVSLAGPVYRLDPA